MTEQLGQWQVEHKVQALEKRQEERELEQEAEKYETKIVETTDYSEFEDYETAVNRFEIAIRQAYKDGYEQGQKEEHNKWCSNPTWVLQLEKENAELKLKITRLKNIIKNTYKGINNQSELLKDTLEELDE